MPLLARCALRTCVTSGLQPPQELPARVQVLSWPSVVQPASTAEHSSPLLTPLHEQICAEGGNEATPVAVVAAFVPPREGSSSCSGRSGIGSALCIICSREL